ncbi:MAG: MBL fold metallo-hydrolase [Phycisphaerales bacterium]|nr:MBL fold metallo-hydrolase [Planctomycetota bacterium]MBL6997547.1 MBL fold metallo-hydrolase [Phycisphaerales bacterium]
MTVQITPFVLGDYQTNCHVLTQGDECWVVDCGYSPEPLIEYLETEKLQPKAILLTHCHADHIAGLDKLRDSIGNVPVYCHPIEHSWNMDPTLNLSGFAGTPITVSPPDKTLQDGDVLSLGDSTWRVVHTPGHSPGSVCFINDDANEAIVGDTLFAGSIGRHDFPTSNVEDLRHTIANVLMNLPDEMNIYPGHGPASTIGHERVTNPFVVQGF